MLLSTTVHRDRPSERVLSVVWSRDIQWRDFEKHIPKVLFFVVIFGTRRTTHKTKAEKIDVFHDGFCRAKNCPRDFLLDVLVFSKRTPPKAAAQKKNFDDDSFASVQVRENLLVLVLVV
jgi:hypothetical protein